MTYKVINIDYSYGIQAYTVAITKWGVSKL